MYVLRLGVLLYFGATELLCTGRATNNKSLAQGRPLPKGTISVVSLDEYIGQPSAFLFPKWIQ
jgi:hypothetical protein